MATETKTSVDTKIYIIGAIAVLGWFLALYFAVEGSRAEEEMTADITRLEQQIATRDAALDTLDGLQTEIAILQPQLDELQAQETSARSEIEALNTQLEETQARKDSLDSDVQAQEQRLADLQSQAEPLEEQINSFDAQKQALEEEIAQQTQELDDTNTRLEEARVAEAELRDTMATLSADSARLAEESASLEASVQELDQKQTDLQANVSDLQTSLERMQQQRDTITTELSELEARRTALTEDVNAASKQRDDLQQILTSLTVSIEEQSNALLRIQQRIGDAQDDQGATSNAASLEPFMVRRSQSENADAEETDETTAMTEAESTKNEETD